MFSKGKAVLLTVAAITAITAFFLVPRNGEWLNKRPVSYWHDFLNQKNDLGLEKRRAARYGSSYTYSVAIARRLKQKRARGPVLVPASSYFKSQGFSYEVPEPAVFYYFSGIRTIAPNSKEAMKATWFAAVRDKNIIIDSFRSRQQLIDSIKRFNRFK